MNSPSRYLIIILVLFYSKSYVKSMIDPDNTLQKDNGLPYDNDILLLVARTLMLCLLYRP